jgi:hypothetical protein
VPAPVGGLGCIPSPGVEPRALAPAVRGCDDEVEVARQDHEDAVGVQQGWDATAEGFTLSPQCGRYHARKHRGARACQGHPGLQ